MIIFHPAQLVLYPDELKEIRQSCLLAFFLFKNIKVPKMLKPSSCCSSKQFFGMK
jgi:hypothetical protein